MSVKIHHPAYKEMEKEWKVVKALTIGPRAVKHNNVVQDILRNPDPEDLTRFLSYVEGAVYTNFTGRTRIGLVGAAFRQEPEINLPVELEYLEDDADGNGLGLNQLAKDLLGDLMSSGREILLVDFPQINEDLTAEESQGLEAVFLRYSALDLINWGSNFMVLEEWYNKSEDEFGHDMVPQHRVLRLRSEGYTQQVYRDEKPFTEEILITAADGSTFDFIPAVVVGAQNNDIDVDEIPLGDIAHVNAGHFRNSADLEENCFVHSQLTLGISTDMDSKEWTEFNPNGVVVGSRSGVHLGANGSFQPVQADPNNLADVLMERKESQMVQLGARIIEKRSGQDTATAARIDATGENSVLADLVNNVEDGISNCIEWAGLFMGATTDGTEYKMNRQFFDDSIDPQKAVAAMQYYDRGIITKRDIGQTARKAGFVSEDTTEEELLNGMEDPGLLQMPQMPMVDDEQ